jgi:hypothetical protein
VTDNAKGRGRGQRDTEPGLPGSANPTDPAASPDMGSNGVAGNGATGNGIVGVSRSPLEMEGRPVDDWGIIGPNPVTEATRQPLGRMRARLESGKIPDFHVRWMNDNERGRIRAALDAGYEFVRSADGKPVSKVVGTKKGGGPMVAFRMKIPLHWYLKDQAEKAQQRAERRADMIHGVTDRGAPGTDGRYLPMHGNSPVNTIRSEDLGRR